MVVEEFVLWSQRKSIEGNEKREKIEEKIFHHSPLPSYDERRYGALDATCRESMRENIFG